ncbi:MAG TPA: carboxymuconolactone decarboxylase family protein, partial [Flavobacteriales bacterium]|nr:carboxymuconolactone decarboxylase family protein [Flavobacteriales bacterium]
MNTLHRMLVLLLLSATGMTQPQTMAQTHTTSAAALDQREQRIVTISAATARGDMPELERALTTGLDAGLTVNEIKEVMNQLYAYCGFPRSLNALGTFMALVDER